MRKVMLAAAIAVVAIPVIAFAVQYNARTEITEWEHGFKTSRVIVTRFAGSDIGYYVSFEFPKNCWDADREELFEYLESHDGWVFQGGGFPCAPLEVKFKGVVDKASANVKIKEILPGLDKVVRGL